MLLDCTDRNEKWYCQHGMIVTDSSTPFLQTQKPEKSPRRTPQAPEVGNNATTKPSLPRNARCRAHYPELRVAKAHRLVHNHSHAASEVSHSRASATSGPGATRRATCSCVVVCDHTQQAGKEMKWKHEKGGPTGTAAPAQKAAGRQSSHAAHRGSACPAKRSLNQMTAAGAGVQHGSAPQVHTAQHTARRILGTCPERGSEEAATTTTWHITSAVLAARGPRRVLCGSGQHTRTLFLSSSCCWAVVVR